jgi:hypothetical protein
VRARPNVGALFGYGSGRGELGGTSRCGRDGRRSRRTPPDTACPRAHIGWSRTRDKPAKVCGVLLVRLHHQAPASVYCTGRRACLCTERETTRRVYGARDKEKRCARVGYVAPEQKRKAGDGGEPTDITAIEAGGKNA